MSAVAALVKRWRLHGATRMEHEQVIYERCADELEGVLGERPRLEAWKSPFGSCVCEGANECPGCNPNVAIELARIISADEERRKHPPCWECGATTAKDAETMCHCSGDKDDCHGCALWPDGDTQPASACGGCGNADPNSRCLGCAHPFAGQSRQDEVARDAARYRELRRIVLADPCAPMTVPERVVYRLLRIDKAKAGTWDAAIDKVIDVALESTGGES